MPDDRQCAALGRSGWGGTAAAPCRSQRLGAMSRIVVAIQRGSSEP